MTGHWPEVGEEVELVVDGVDSRVVAVLGYNPASGWLLGGDQLDADWYEDPVLRDEHGDYRPLQEGRS